MTLSIAELQELIRAADGGAGVRFRISMQPGAPKLRADLPTKALRINAKPYTLAQLWIARHIEVHQHPIRVQPHLKWGARMLFLHTHRFKDTIPLRRTTAGSFYKDD